MLRELRMALLGRLLLWASERATNATAHARTGRRALVLTRACETLASP